MGAGGVGGLSQARSGRVRASARQPAAALGRRAASRERSSQAAPLGCGPVATVSIPRGIGGLQFVAERFRPRRGRRAAASPRFRPACCVPSQAADRVRVARRRRWWSFAGVGSNESALQRVPFAAAPCGGRQTSRRAARCPPAAVGERVIRSAAPFRRPRAGCGPTARHGCCRGGSRNR